DLDLLVLCLGGRAAGKGQRRADQEPSERLHEDLVSVRRASTPSSYLSRAGIAKRSCPADTVERSLQPPAARLAGPHGLRGVFQALGVERLSQGVGGDAVLVGQQADAAGQQDGLDEGDERGDVA